MDQFEALLASADAASVPAPTLADRLAIAAGRAIAWLFIAAMLLTAYEVLMRYAFASPSNWVLPTTTTLCQIGFAFGGAWCMARGEHIRITFLTDKMRPQGRRRLELATLGVGAFYLAGMCWATWLDARASLLRFDGAGAWSPELTPGPPYWPLPSIGKASLVLGAVLFLLVVISHFVRVLRGKDA